MEKVDLGLKVFKANKQPPLVTGDHGMQRLNVITSALATNSSLVMGIVVAPPGTVTGSHDHGQSEIGGYVVSGRSLFKWGSHESESCEMEPGDFFLVTPGAVHSEQTLGDEDFVYVVARVG